MIMNLDEPLRTPSKKPRLGSISSPSDAAKNSGKKGTKIPKITNYFPKVNSPLGNRNNSNSNQDLLSENENNLDEISKDASSSSMRIPERRPVESGDGKELPKEYVFVVPSSDDDTQVSSKGSTRNLRKRPPSIHSNNSKSSDGFVLSRKNNELSIETKKRGRKPKQAASEQLTTTSNHEYPNIPNSGDTDSRGSIPDKRIKSEQNNVTPRINRIQPTLLGSRTKMIDFQSVPSDLNMPREKASELIERLFLVKMPDDFFLFWEFAKTINHRKPCSAFAMSGIDLTLVGPFDVLSGLITDFHGFKKDHLLRHCRYYYDPPEFQTVFARKDLEQTHYGYHRDEPEQSDPIVVMNKAAKGGQLYEAGDNLFTVIREELDIAIASLSSSSQDVPTLMSSSSKKSRSNASDTTNKQSQLEKAKAKQELTIIRDKLFEFCASHGNISCESHRRCEYRRSRRCAKTLNTLGIVVPKDGDVGYRDIGITDPKLRSMLNRISEFPDDDKTKCNLYRELHQLITNVNMANDECDFGMGLELGLDLFYQGDQCFHRELEMLLSNAYTLLGREAYIDILKAHISDRRRGDKVSLLDVT